MWKSKRTKHTILGTLLEVEMFKKCNGVAARSTCRSQNVQSTRFSEHFWNLRCSKSVRSCRVKPCRSQNAQSTPFSEDFWKLRCSTSARSCGAKHMPKSKRTKHTILGTLLEVKMFKECTELRREAHVEVKTHKAHHSRNTFGS